MICLMILIMYHKYEYFLVYIVKVIKIDFLGARMVLPFHRMVLFMGREISLERSLFNIS